MSSQLPRPTAPFQGVVTRLLADATPSPLPAGLPEPGSPNVIVILLDDVGFASSDVFGGPVPMPTLARIAERGLRFNQFHTTALCSPTRAALMTGRNHHTAHMGTTPEGGNSFPGYDSVVPRETATVAEILRQNGWATGCFGKWHLTPTWELGPAGPFDRWPTGMGFDRFYGIMSAECSQYEPPVYDQTTPISPYLGREGYHFGEDMADQAIAWIERCRATAPDRPFFCYFSTPAVHTPHHVPAEWADRFRGRFDAGWDSLREEIFRRQLDAGVIPSGTQLTPRPEQLPSWDEYPDRYKPVASRLMEVFAGFLAHTDAQVGRVIDAIERMGELDNTIVVYIVGDNGASGEGGIHGAWSAPSFQNGTPEDPEWLLDHMADFGSEHCENHYNAAWAWALDTPFQWMKQVASHFGGTRNAMAMSWPRGIADHGGLRSQFHHVIDVMPTLLDLCGVAQPTHVNGIEQLPVEGVSMRYALDDAQVQSRRTTQYFELLGNRGIYHEGWMASCFHGRTPWTRFASVPFDGEQERWELYDITDDFSQSVDLSAEHPDRLTAMIERFEQEAARVGAHPLKDSGARGPNGLPAPLGERQSMTYTRAHVRIPERTAVNIKNASFAITARIVVDEGGAQGVVACQGGNMSGWSLYLEESGAPVFLYNCFGHELTFVRGDAPLAPGHHGLDVHFASDGGFGAGGVATLRVDGVEVASARVPRTVPVVFSMSGETFDVGVDTGAPVGPYPVHFPCTAEIIDVTVSRLSEPYSATRRAMREGLARASMASQ